MKFLKIDELPEVKPGEQMTSRGYIENGERPDISWPDIIRKIENDNTEEAR